MRSDRRSQGGYPGLKRFILPLAVLLLATAGAAEVCAFAAVPEQAPATPDQLRQGCEMAPGRRRLPPDRPAASVRRPRPRDCRAGPGAAVTLGDATVRASWVYADLFGYVLALDVHYGQTGPLALGNVRLMDRVGALPTGTYFIRIDEAHQEVHYLVEVDRPAQEPRPCRPTSGARRMVSTR